ncbi:uncharacterized protein PY17X_0800081 [Plasmodium yoelii]|uniref:PIR protein n=3 Tax=Plasmodium yoelii TaxID=5861 RepID=A0AAE9WQA0_PLAYO|nr:uncharacterized protein PY17X_0800081 [Plasmodium yoelii]EAA22542.1 putative yir3 protein [Plasmodium yoelii yoelii]WBY56499.1 PIR protein [Plasmodium yoelii yoelii]CDS44037.1 YIR protein [Plasmodium yoelii]VTZ77000.1 PIR protein [Plasmodium yoelii]|eukprot:XP_730977.1 uncharacterized protein PY17X_0800081 [Plasmodium yoelii]
MSKDLCELINAAVNYIVDDPNNPRGDHYGSLFNSYCPDDKCDTDDKKVSSTFISLLKSFKNIDDKENLESDKFVEYTILWLSYIINQITQNGTTKLYDFYTKNIESNSNYYEEDIFADNNIRKDVIDKKIGSMNIDINDISNFYVAFKSLCNMYSEFNEETINCTKYLQKANEFSEKYQKVIGGSSVDKHSSYYKLLYNLSNDHEYFKNKYNSEECNNFSSLADYSRSSVIKNTLITIGIIFVAASILLGVSYKYSLFGFRKRPEKQHLREMLKK